ncbi:MAG: SDR family NAD(P)-dependent oxidoreductase [Ottowia sp.]|uniref:SDR family NAD(P)-dependent oxidoreductase n=1 Tax=Ottowia sp. TaxID=1898956 RepID=UPI0039E4A6C2
MTTAAFDGKTVVITGAAGGIGSAIAERFARDGARLALVDLDAELLDRQVHALGGQVAQALPADVCSESETDAALQSLLRRWSSVDIAILNAGTEGRIAPLGEQSASDFDRVMAINVRGVFLWLSRLMKVMQSHGGAITIISSTAGLRGSVGLGPYCASKHAVVGLAKTAALEGAKHGIRVNTIHPGPVDTRMMEAIEAGRAGARAQAMGGIPLRRYGTPQEVAAMAAFLSSDEAAYSTGGSFLMDGGAMAGKI